MADMAIPGELEVVDDVPAAFAELVVATAPASIALSGGDLARKCYERLSATPMDWSGVDVFFGDERFVPVSHDDSNEGMARAALLDAVQPRKIHGMARGDTPIAAAGSYDALVRDAPPIDLIHLGIGPDGHTASLFPGSSALDEDECLVVATGDDLHPQPRITFTFAGIARCRIVVVTVAGAEKRDAMKRLRDGDDLPAARIRAAERLVWLADAEALGAYR
jgi:6-phosphogluconolactonase